MSDAAFEELRDAFNGDMADKLGLSVSELRAIKREAGFDDAKIAEKLGISVDVLRSIRDKARETATNTRKIRDKNWTPKVIVSVTTTFTVSARDIAALVKRYLDDNGGAAGAAVRR